MKSYNYWLSLIESVLAIDILANRCGDEMKLFYSTY